MKDESLHNIEREIRECEQHLEQLRKEYMAKAGHMPLRKLSDSSWKWTIFMSLGYAFISMIVYLLGIGKAGSGTPGIPSMFFNVEFSYFVILTFYPLLMILMVQAKKLKGFQSAALLLGFWCAHWLIYDWGWYFYLMGIGDVTPNPAFWQSLFGRDFLVVDTTMWMFLTEAIIGGCLALYTFTVPKSKRHLIPPFTWLYAVYFNAPVLDIAGVDPETISIVGIVLLVAVIGSAGFFSVQRIVKAVISCAKRADKPDTTRTKVRRWKLSLDPLGIPFAAVMISMVALTNLVLVINPAVGLFFGMIPWYVVPLYHVLIHSTGIAKSKRWQKILATSILTGLFVAFVVACCVLPLGDWF
ncbi:MAG: hypothetical protein ACFFCS_09155 [Candidatus Hodarchaeota archaeon]